MAVPPSDEVAVAGEGAHPRSWKGTSWITSCSCLGSNPKSLHEAGLGAGNPLPSQSCWTLGARHPPSLSHMVLTLFQPHCSQELSALGLLLLPSSHPPHPTNSCQQPLMTLLAGPKDSHTSSVHQGRGAQPAPVIPLQIPVEQHFSHGLYAHIHMVL